MQNKILSYLVVIPMMVLSVVPSIYWAIPMPPDGLWFWYVLIAAVFGFTFLFLDVPLAFKIFSVWSFLNCFFSRGVHISFTCFIWIVMCLYFYWLCLKVKDWDVIFKAMQAIVLLNIFMLVMQAFTADRLLNFGLERSDHYGVIGQHMQMASFSVVYAAMLLSFNPINLVVPFFAGIYCHSAWAMISVAIGGILLFWGLPRMIKRSMVLLIAIFCLGAFSFIGVKYNKVHANLSTGGRMPVWQKAIELSKQHPIAGWGMGNFKTIFPVLGKINDSVPYKTAHNFVVQLIFEFGYLFTAFVVAYLLLLGARLFVNGLYGPLAGLAMIVSDGMVHFPDRMIQCGLIIVAFLAYCQRRLQHGT